METHHITAIIMGRLIGLELENFKSYKGRTVIGLGSSNFTSIIGPNGSGKSNLMDAISFALGLSSSQLRSQSMRDLIYRGRRNNKHVSSGINESNNNKDNDGGFGVENDDTNNRQILEADPTTAYVMAIYEKDDGDILKFKRSISTNGSTDYRINGKSVTRLSYTLTLQQENILIKARNFLVFQGDVEQIASQSPKHLTTMIEEISGSGEYVQEYEQRKEEWEKAREVSNNVFSRKRTLNTESKQYKEQAIEQRQFESNIILRNDLIKKIHLYKLYHNEKKRKDLQKKMDVKNEELKNAKLERSKLESSLKALAASQSKSVLELKHQKSEIDRCLASIDSGKRDLIPVDTSIDSLVSKIELLKRKIADLEEDLDSQKERVRNAKRQLAESRKLFDAFEESATKASNAQASINITSEGRLEYEQLRSEYLASGGSSLEEQIAIYTSERDTIQANQKSLESKKATANDRVLELHSNLRSDLKPRLADLESELSKIINEKTQKSLLRDDLIAKKDAHNQDLLQINTRLRDTLLKLEELSFKQRESNRQKQLHENVATLKKMMPGTSVRGIVHELLRPSQQKYDLALLTILGKNGDAIIVESSAIAFRCVEILKERRSGVATFIPLDSIENDSININYLRTMYKEAVPGVDVIEYDDKSLEPAIKYIVGDTLITSDISTARALRWNNNNKNNSSQSFRGKIVTLLGSIIHKSGQMTGGDQGQKSSASLSWDKQEWKRLNEQKDFYLSQLAKLLELQPKEMELNLLTEEINLLDDKIPLLKNQKSSLERLIKDRETEVEFHAKTLTDIQEEIDRELDKVNHIDIATSRVNEQVQTLKNTVFAEFCNKYGLLNGIKEYEELHGSRMRVRAKERLQFTKAISALENKESFEEAKCEEIEKRKSILQNQLVDHEADLSSLREQKAATEELLDKFEAELQVLNEEKQRLQSTLNSQSKSVKSIESDVSELSVEISTMAKLSILIEENILKVDTERANTLRNCKLQNIILPLLRGTLDSLSVQLEQQDVKSFVYDVEVDYEMLDDKYKAACNIRLEMELETLLQNTIEVLEQLTPNSKAMERFKDVEAKLRSYDTEYSAARQSERRAFEKFKNVKDKRYEKFMSAFNHISSRIDSIYKELTKSRMFEIGGSAYLMLEDEEEPYVFGIKYHAVPPMKRLEDMELLSGGEKTIAALALLFAIHSFQPAPFFVLDEVDAALDNSNVARIGNFIKNHAGSALQFIVISLKSNLYEKSDALVGVYREQGENTSKTVTLDLGEYQDEEVSLRPNPITATS